MSEYREEPKREPKQHEGRIEIKAGSKVDLKASVIRGPESWAFFYIVLALAITIEIGIIQLITPLSFPWNLLVLAAVALGTVRLIIGNGRVHDWLIRLRSSYENKAR